jgi:hypothetical protein
MEIQSNSAVAHEIHNDLPCSICGYNLKGLLAAGNCPECGQPVARTYQFDLAKADPGWLRRQAATMPWLGALCILSFAPTASSLAFWFAYGMSVLFSAVNVWNCHRLGRADPADPTDRYGSVRRGVLLASIVVLISVGIGMPRVSRFAFSASAQFWIWFRVFALAINTFLALFLVAHICRRAGRKGLHKHAQFSLWTFSFTQPGYLFFFLVQAREFPETVAYVYSAYSYFTYATLFLTLILLGRVYEVLQMATATAESTTSMQAENFMTTPHGDSRGA